MKRSKHSLSHYKLLTMNMGELIPLSWYDTLPGDTIQHSTSSLIRCSPLLSPVMHPVNVRIHHWFVPLRLIWEDFEDFITGGPDGTYTATPPFKSQSVTEGTLLDYLGVPPGTTNNIDFSALPIRAYQLIFNEFYRDQDLVSEVNLPLTSGSDATSAAIQNVAWEKDYFTTARPWEQKGNQVYIPLYDEQVPVQSDGSTIAMNRAGVENATPTVNNASSEMFVSGTMTGSGALKFGTTSDVTATGLEADLTAATGIPVEDLRLALGVQRYQEARARFGSRYSEYLAYLGVNSSDARLQRPEYLGGGRQTIQFSEVLSTDGANTGDMKGHGIAAMRTNKFRKYFEEHGICMTLMSVIPKSIYTQGLNQKFSRTTKEDYFQKELQFIGEQEIYNKEVYTPHTTPEGIFGYQARYDEYRSQPSSISGEFLSTNDHWHYGRIFASDPALNSTFVTATPTKRVNASSGTDSLYIMANHSIQARRSVSAVAKTQTKL